MYHAEVRGEQSCRRLDVITVRLFVGIILALSVQAAVLAEVVDIIRQGRARGIRFAASADLGVFMTLRIGQRLVPPPLTGL